jgi:cholesterol transport system auxiliary component
MVEKVKASAIRTGTTWMVLASVLAGCSTAAQNDTYSLGMAPVIEGKAAKNRQVLVPEPTALKALDSEQLVIRVSPSEIRYLANSQWSDRLPKMVQSRLVQAFENTGQLGGVGRPGEGLAIDYQILTDIRSFEITTDGTDKAVVEIAAKILNDRTGTIKAQKIFRAVVSTPGTDNPAFVEGLDEAFNTVAGEVVVWTLQSI